MFPGKKKSPWRIPTARKWPRLVAALPAVLAFLAAALALAAFYLLLYFVRLLIPLLLLGAAAVLAVVTAPKTDDQSELQVYSAGFFMWSVVLFVAWYAVTHW